MKSLFWVSALVAGANGQAAYGTCVTGQDPVGLSQSCNARCHIYHTGDYGACGHQFTDDDVNGSCGTPQKPCKSTFNAGWDSGKANCGNCYYVEKKYDDGTVLSTYIQTVDTNGSDSVKFEMAQNAWKNLCPYGCNAIGNCAHSASQCQYGVLPDSGMPGPCFVQYEGVTFQRVECGQSVGGGSTGGNGGGNGGIGGGNGGGQPTLPPPPGGNGGNGGAGPTLPPPPGGNGGNGGNSGNGGNGGWNPPTPPPGNNGGNGGSDSASCASRIGSPGNPTWDAYCKSLCDYYSANPIFCSGAPLVNCITSRHPYCVG